MWLNLLRHIPMIVFPPRQCLAIMSAAARGGQAGMAPLTAQNRLAITSRAD
jgi:hypothetical protein